MTQAETSRRRFLAVFGLSGATVATTMAVAALPRQLEIKAPVTPDQYIAEMQALGWRVFAGVYENDDGVRRHCGVIERDPDKFEYKSDDYVLRMRRLRCAIADTGFDFYDRASDRLFELGLTEDLIGELRVRGHDPQGEEL